MKYIIFLLVLANLSACSLFDNEDKNKVVPTPVPGVSESGTQSRENVTLSGTDTPSTTGATQAGSGNILTPVASTGTTTPTVSSATGSKTQTATGSPDAKDTEVESITNDINKIFDDIAKGK